MNRVQQDVVGGMILGTIDDKFVVCREIVLNANPTMKEDAPLFNGFAKTPLEVGKQPFFFVAYDTETLEYVMRNAALQQELPKARILRTEKGVPFYLAQEADVNSIFETKVHIDLTAYLATKELPAVRKRLKKN